jgi:RNA polymerase sigma factor (sigma-70 family)
MMDPVMVPIRQYAQSGSAEAFRAVVLAHVDAVYSECLRLLRDPSAAEEVTQQVFITLSQKAARLSPNVVLSGWLFTTARYCCSTYRRSAARRLAAERKAALMRTEAVAAPLPDDGSSDMEAVLDDAIADLGRQDRDAVLLRFFDGRSLREVGGALGVSEDAAKQRVFRALEKMRNYFSRRGLVVPSVGLGAFMAQAVKHAAPGVAEGAVKAGISHGAMQGANLLTRLMTLAPKLAAGVAAAAIVATGVLIVGHGALGQSPAAGTATPIPPPAAGGVVLIAADIPATQPVSQSTPGDALNKLCRAMAADDKVAIDQCLCDDGKNPNSAALGRAFVEETASVYRMERTWQGKFGTSMKVDGFGFDDFEGGSTYDVLFRGTMDTPGGPDVSISGDVAKIRVSASPEAFAGAGPDRITARERWSGAMLVFNYVNGDWKLNTDRTFNFLVFINRVNANVAESLDVESRIESGISRGFDDIAGKIDSGEIVTLRQANLAMQKCMSDLFRNVGVEGSQVFTLPVIGG